MRMRKMIGMGKSVHRQVVGGNPHPLLTQRVLPREMALVMAQVMAREIAREMARLLVSRAEWARRWMVRGLQC